MTSSEHPSSDRSSEQSRDESLLLDALLGGLGGPQEADLAERIAAEPELARRKEDLVGFLSAEQAAFEPAVGEDSYRREAKRMSAWIQDRVRSEEAQASQQRQAVQQRRAGRSRGWARLLAWSVALHVVVLGVLAFVLREQPDVEKSRGAMIALTEDFGGMDEELDPLDSDFARAYPNLEWRDVGTISDDLVLREQDSYDADLPDVFGSVLERNGGLDKGVLDADSGRRGAFDQPVGVVAATIRRTNPDLKRRRLDLLGFNPDGTLRAVEKGLDYLAPRQADDGSWSGVAGGRSDLEQTSVALLAFLGDGNGSRVPSARKGRDAVVARGIHWVRDLLFNASRSDADRKQHLEEHSVSVLGPATVALCEDYMLSYGWLSPDAAEKRAREIAQLAVRLESARENTGDAVEAPWAIWGLDAAARVGVVGNTDTHMRAFRSWVETASAAKPTLSAMSFLSVGTALLYSERGAEKPRFLAWSKANADQLVSRLGPGGYVRAEDPIGETALVLLGLQVSYRTY